MACTSLNRLVTGVGSLSMGDKEREENEGYQRKNNVHITDFGENFINPEPIVIEETDLLLEEYLSPSKLRALTGVNDLEEVAFLEMKVDTSETSLGNFGAMLPNMRQLKLNNSIITSIRDLGTSLQNLRVLWMAQCGLSDLDGISSMTSLQELYLAYNDISDVSPCSWLTNLQILDLEGNSVAEMSQVEFLAFCPSLKSLTLEGNPVCFSSSALGEEPSGVAGGGEYDYRASVRKALSSLNLLDDESLGQAPSSLGHPTLNRSSEWLLVNQAIRDHTDSSDSLESTGSGRPITSSGRPPTSKRPVSAIGQRPGSAIGQRPGSAGGQRIGKRPGTASAGESRPDTAGSDVNVTAEDTSDLTHGSSVALCGNPVVALRKRRKQTDNSKSLVFETPSLFSQYHHQPEHTYDTIEEVPHSKGDLIAELIAFKVEMDRKIDERRILSQPQVMVIEHDSDESGGDSSHESDPAEEDEEEEEEEEADVGRAPVTAHPPSLPTLRPRPPPQPLSAGARPKTSGDFRARRFLGQRSLEDSMRAQLRLDTDESYEAETGAAGEDAGSRPVSGPVGGNRTYKVDVPVDKNRPKIIDRERPVVRAATHTPPSLAHRANLQFARPSTAKATMQRMSGAALRRNHHHES